MLEGAAGELTREQVTEAYFGLAGGAEAGGSAMIWVNAVVQGILLGGLYALFACGLSLMFGVMRIINLAHGDIARLGAYLRLAGRRARSHVSPFLALLRRCCRSCSSSATSSSARCSSAACARAARRRC